MSCPGVAATLSEAGMAPDANVLAAASQIAAQHTVASSEIAGLLAVAKAKPELTRFTDQTVDKLQ